MRKKNFLGMRAEGFQYGDYRLALSDIRHLTQVRKIDYSSELPRGRIVSIQRKFEQVSLKLPSRHVNSRTSLGNTCDSSSTAYVELSPQPWTSEDRVDR